MSPSQRFVYWEADAGDLRCRRVGGEVGALGFPLERWSTQAHFLPETLFAAERERFVERCRAAVAGCPSIERYRVRAGDGGARPFEVALQASHAGRATWLRGEMVSLARPEPPGLRALGAPRTQGALGHIVARFDARLRHLYVSPSIERIVGFPAAVFIGKTNEELGMPPALVRAWREMLSRTFRRAEPQQLEFHFLLPGAPAQLARLESVLTPQFDGRGDVRFVSSRAEVFPAARRRAPARQAAPRPEPSLEPVKEAPAAPRASSLSLEERFEWLSQVSQALATPFSEESLYRTLERLALPLLGDRGGLALLRGQHLEPVAAFSWVPGEARDGPWLRPFAFNTRVVLAGRAQLLSGPAQQVLDALAQDAEHHRQLREAGLLDFLSAPLFRDGVCCGCLWFASTDPQRRLSLAELRLAEQLALLASPALEALRLRLAAAELHQRELWLRRKTEGLHRVAAALGEALLPVQVADAVMREVKTALGAAAAVVYRLEPSGTALELLRASGYTAEATRGFERLPLTFVTPITEAVRRREGVWVESAEAFRRDYPELAARVPPRPGARVAVPLLIEGRALGVLAMSFETDRSFSQEERAFGLALAQLCAQTIERVRLYQLLQGQLEEFHTLLEVLPVGIRIARDRDGERIEHNPAFARLLGGEQQLPGARFFHQGRELEPEEQPLQRASATGRPVIDLELEVQPAEGPRRTVLGYAAPLFDRQRRPRGAIAAFLDITERKSAAEAQRFLADSGPLLAASLESEQTFHALTRLCVPTLARLALLYESVGESFQLRSHAHVEPAREPLAVRLCEKLKLLEQSPVRRVLGRRKSFAFDVGRAVASSRYVDPEVRQLLERLSVRGLLLLPLVDSKRLLGVLVLGFEEAACSRDVRTLARAYAQRAALAMDNVRLYREAQQAISLRDEFLTVAGHELRTPLTALQLGLRNLDRANTDRDAAKLRKWAAQCQKQGARLGQLVDSLLDVGRITAGRLPLMYEQVELSALVAECVARMAPAFEEAGSSVSFHSPGPLTGVWDALRLEQVVTNLLSNAVKYGQGKPVNVSLFATSEVAAVRVEDHGIGIAEQDQARIFQRFERAVSERHYWGMGLGLWLVKELVTRLGGRIELQSVPGQGSTFTVYLPRARPESAA